MAPARQRLWPVTAVGINDLSHIGLRWVDMIMRVFKVMGHMVVVLGQDPLVHGRPLSRPTGCRTLRVFLWRRIRIMMEMVVQIAVGTANGENAMLRGEAPVVDIGRPPEVATGGEIAELHHPGRAPDVIGLLGNVVVADVVLPEPGTMQYRNVMPWVFRRSATF